MSNDDSTSTDEPPRRWFSATDAAAYLEVDRTTFYRWRKRYDVPEHRTPSGRPKFDKADLDNVLVLVSGTKKETPGEGSPNG